MLCFYEWLCRQAERLPGYCLVMGRPSWIQIVLYGAGMAGALYGIRRLGGEEHGDGMDDGIMDGKNEGRRDGIVGNVRDGTDDRIKDGVNNSNRDKVGGESAGTIYPVSYSGNCMSVWPFLFNPASCTGKGVRGYNAGCGAGRRNRDAYGSIYHTGRRRKQQ